MAKCDICNKQIFESSRNYYDRLEWFRNHKNINNKNIVACDKCISNFSKRQMQGLMDSVINKIIPDFDKHFPNKPY
ncbi:MAG: hypothetical protein WCO84_00970 [bacterium]